jgi:hypothetical protein
VLACLHWLVFLWGCGDAPPVLSTDTDAGPGDAGPTGDGMIVSQPGPCAEFEAPMDILRSFPGRYEGNLLGSAADFEVPSGTCEQESASFPISAPGADRVVGLVGLQPGELYAVRLHSPDDLAMYIATGCLPGQRRGEIDGCLAFVDSAVENTELGIFAAPEDGTAYVVIDHFRPGEPPGGTFALDVYPPSCRDDNQCTDPALPYCVDHRCVECRSDFNCGARSRPVCEQRRNVCARGVDLCSDDDEGPVENDDDGPAGARDITPTGTEIHSQSGRICSASAQEADFYSFRVEEDGQDYEITLDWQDWYPGTELDLAIYDHAGRAYGMSYYQRPQQVRLTYLPRGTYYARVKPYGPPQRLATPYTIEAVNASASACSSVADCAASYQTQLFRAECQGSGACAYLEVNAPPPQRHKVGERCDSPDDCASGRCTVTPFVKDAHEKAFCTRPCTSDRDCEREPRLGTDFVCTDYYLDNVCVARCSDPEHCPVMLGSRPYQGLWHHLACQAQLGECQLSPPLRSQSPLRAVAEPRAQTFKFHVRGDR